jgi:tetratricopeptide (TPR) repeat protein
MDSMTMTGTVMGTAGYLAPEQAQGERAGPASDRYALGVVAFELLTGTRPFASDSPTAEASAHVHADVPAVSEHGDLPPELDGVFREALAKRPEDRYGSAAEFVAALRSALDEAAGKTRVLGAVAPPPRRAVVRTAPLWPLIVGGLAVAAIAGVILAAVLSSGSSPKPVVAQTVTQQGTTVRETVTTAPPTTTASAAAPAADGHTLNDKGYALMQQGDFAGALPYLQQAVQRLQGVGPADPYEGYANYNLGYTLLQLGQCDTALTYLQRADQFEPGNHDVHRALKSAEHCGNKGND